MASFLNENTVAHLGPLLRARHVSGGILGLNMRAYLGLIGTIRKSTSQTGQLDYLVQSLGGDFTRIGPILNEWAPKRERGRQMDDARTSRQVGQSEAGCC